MPEMEDQKQEKPKTAEKPEKALTLFEYAGYVGLDNFTLKVYSKMLENKPKTAKQWEVAIKRKFNK